ncbi:MAG TPA: amidohydrolase family protein [Polyangiaceae bacterium]
MSLGCQVAPKRTSPSTPAPSSAASADAGAVAFNDCHVHLTNYVQDGIDVRALLQIMGNRVGRAVLFGIPLQQLWSHRVSGAYAPTYYLNTDSPLYYYSFTDAYIAMAYLSLDKDQRARFDPMITGFNPADMYAVDHIERVLRTFPGVFSGIGEFSIHKEFVSSKVAGDTPSLDDPALDRVLAFAGESGLVALIHNDMDVPFAKPGAKPVYLESMRQLLARHPRTKIIWAHAGLGRVVHPVEQHAKILADLLVDPALSHVFIDISWSEAAKYLTATPRAVAISSELIERFPDRFLFGTDEVAPPDQRTYLRVYHQYRPLWANLRPSTSIRVRSKNYERIFDEARVKVRAWERQNR